MTEATPLRIGLTGGIASGKSVVADMFAELGIPVIDTDIIAREIVAPGQPALDAICRHFGDDIITADGNLERAALRKKIFASDEARHALEAILHPRIHVEARRQSDEAGGAYQLIVVPLLVDSALLQFVDRVLVVDCSLDIQIQRLLERDSETLEQTKRILAAQPSREQRLAIADDVITNEGSLAELRSQVLDLDRNYRKEARR